MIVNQNNILLIVESECIIFDVLKHIKLGQTIILDTGNTVEIVNYLPHDFEYLRLVPHALNVATAHCPYIELVHLFVIDICYMDLFIDTAESAF